MVEMNRRSFVKGSAGAAGIMLAGQLIGTSKSWAGANDRIRVAVMGVHGRGKDHIAGHQSGENVQVAALCDPDRNVLRERAESVEKEYNLKVDTETDIRKILERDDIDAISIATPNHWHSLATIWACQAGKDVYVEKPGSHNIYEGRKMVEAAHKYNRIVQHGVQLRSSSAIQEAVEKLREGVIGNVYMARGLCYKWRPSIGHKPEEPAPDYLDFDLWLGPAQERPYTPNLVHYNWHWHWDYGNGDVGNQGIHETDMCLWGLGLETLPDEITGMGGKFLWDDDKETPEVLTTLFKFTKENKMIQFEVRPWCTNMEDGVGIGNIFYGDKGYMLIKGYGRYEVYLGKDREPGPVGDDGPGNKHFHNFHAAMRSRKASDQNGPVETAHRASAIAHLGNISYRLGRVLHFNAEKEKFEGDREANKMLTREYRKPFVVPEKV